MKPLRRLLSRLSGLFISNHNDQRLHDEFEQHIAQLTEDYIKSGMSPTEARRQAILEFGPVEALKESYRDQRGFPGIEAFTSDIVFGARQLKKHRVASAAAILSLALAIGATTAAFRLVDAVLLGALPIDHPERLLFVANTFIDRNGQPDYFDESDYPTFRRYREVLKDHADSLVVGLNAKQPVMFGAGDEPERLCRQFLSGNVFEVFGLQPALGRLLSPQDDVKPGGHPVAVISYDYWTRRFGRDPAVIGKTFRMAKFNIEIVGVAPKGFIGTEPGEITDAFIPAMMNPEAINSPGWSWFRHWVRPKPGVSPDELRQILQSVFAEDQKKQLKKFHSDSPKQMIDNFLKQSILLLPAGSGASGLQKQYLRPLLILSGLVAMVLLIACTNVANLLTAQSTGRAREMALRVSIGAGRWRLIQLMLVESAMLALSASALGVLFAAWAAPIVISMLRVPGDPVRLVLETGWREIAFSITLALMVTILFGLAPALKASGVQPISALKGTDDPRARPRLMNTLLAAQVAFCVMVLFVAGLFVGTFQRLSNRPIGFTAERILILNTAAVAQSQPPETWTMVADHLREIPGVASVAISGWPLLSDNRWTGEVRLPGRAVEKRPPYFLNVSAGFFQTMQIAMVDGRDFRPNDTQPKLNPSAQPTPGVGIVNEAFARSYFDGRNPVGQSVDMRLDKDKSAPLEIIGLVRDAAYSNLREPMRPTVYVPIEKRGNATFLVRTALDPESLAPILRQEVSRARSDFKVVRIERQQNLIRWHLVRERLLATLSLFFAAVALALAAIGLYGILNYSVTRQRREIGIRMALGARSIHVLTHVTNNIAAMTCLGSAIGLAAGLASGEFLEALLFEVKATDFQMVLAPVLALGVVALLAAIPPAMRAAKIDPAQTLRSD